MKETLWPGTPEPPEPFNPQEFILPQGSIIYRVHTNRARSTEFNSQYGSGGRFHFFGNPAVPVLYGAVTEVAAVCESLLRRIPASGGNLPRGQYREAVLAGLTTIRPLRLASFLGTGLRALGVEATQLTDTPGDRYPTTRLWAQATHHAGFDGIAWMSRRNNSDAAYVFFGDRCGADAVKPLPGSGRIFATGIGLDWLIDTCVPLHVEVLT